MKREEEAVTHLTEEDLVLFYYREAADCAAIESHLDGCGTCRASYRKLQEALAAVEALPVPEPDETFESRIWRRLQPALETGPRQSWLAFLTPARLAVAAAMAVLLIAAFVAGRYWPQPATTTVATTAVAGDEAGRDRILLVAIGEHLDRTEMALLELVNNQSGRPIDISSQQNWVRELVPANRLYRQTAVAAGEAGVAGVLDDVERVLLDIAHGPSTLSSDEFDEIRQRLETQGIIFKVQVLGENVRERQLEAARALARRRT
jgi:hypothetical protein